MVRTASLLLLLILIIHPARAQTAEQESRIYGQVHTDDGDVFEGFIRWDKNEVSWVDVLDGTKRFTREDRERHQKRGIEIFGLRINYDGGSGQTSRTSGIRFGHLQTLENTGSNTALLTLKSGESITFRGGSTDIGTDNRGIVVEDSRQGEVELRWRDVERVDFMAPEGRHKATSERLYGTLSTRRGDVFTGFICWDVDEVLSSDILDGTDRDDRRRKIPFGDIAAISRYNNSSAQVTLTTGEELVLRGTNDVDNDNRGILVLDPNLGQVRVGWDDFEEVNLSTPPTAAAYRTFNGGKPIRGTAYLRDREKYTGEILWDDDEAMTWELLNGEIDGVELEIEFGMIREIDRISSREARITLRDGRSFDLRGSNDVNDDNDGIVVLHRDGSSRLIEWNDFERVVFDH